MDKIICTICKKEKSSNKFGIDKKKKNGRRSNCNVCKNRVTREYKKNRRKSDREYARKTNAYLRAFLHNNPDKAKKYYKTKTSTQLLNWSLRKYGITLEEYDRMAENQGGVCAICGNKDILIGPDGTSKIRRLAVDHCHDTNKVRGLLCSCCNGGLGLFKDSNILLKKALKYLTKEA